MTSRLAGTAALVTGASSGSVDMILIRVRIVQTKGGAMDSRSAAPLFGLGRAQVPSMVARLSDHLDTEAALDE
jgi:hypothetical protein